MKGRFDLCIEPGEDRSGLLDQFEQALADLVNATLGGGEVERASETDDGVTFAYTCKSDDARRAIDEIGKLGLRYGFSPGVLRRHEVPLD